MDDNKSFSFPSVLACFERTYAHVFINTYLYKPEGERTRKLEEWSAAAIVAAFLSIALQQSRSNLFVYILWFQICALKNYNVKYEKNELIFSYVFYIIYLIF